jgi:pimeloyl-ACP methyl ester carboxylesterase
LLHKGCNLSEYSIDVLNASFHVHEQGQGLPVIFLHAGVCDQRMWYHQLSNLSDDVRGIAYDRRGFGQTSSATGTYDDKDDLIALMDQLKIERAVMVGCSMGGGLAIEAALACPDRVSGLFLVASSMRGAPIPPQTELEDQLDEQYEALEQAEDPDALNQFEADLWLEGVGQKAGRTGEANRALFLEMNARHMQLDEGLEHSHRKPFFDRLSEIKVPTLLLAGALDFSYYRITNAKAAELIAGAEEHVFDNSAHLPSMDNPERFNKLLSDFLAQY